MKIGYARISTADKQTTNLQVDALVAAGVDLRNIYQDKKSGASTDRPGLVKALSFLASGDTLVVYRLDRLARSLSHLVAIVDDLKARQVHLVSLTEAIDTSTPAGVLVLQFFGMIGEFERALTTERVNAGLAAAKRRGRRGGRPIVISDEKLAYIRADLDLGMTKKEVVRKYGVKRATLYAALERPSEEAPADRPASDTVDIEELI